MKQFNAWISGTHTHDSEIRSVLQEIEYNVSVPIAPAGSKTWSKRFTIPSSAVGIPALLNISDTGITTVSSLILRHVSGDPFVIPHRLGEGIPSAPASAWHGQPITTTGLGNNQPLRVSGVWALLNATFPPLPSSTSIALLTVSGDVEVDVIIIGT